MNTNDFFEALAEGMAQQAVSTLSRYKELRGDLPVYLARDLERLLTNPDPNWLSEGNWLVTVIDVVEPRSSRPPSVHAAVLRLRVDWTDAAVPRGVESFFPVLDGREVLSLQAASGFDWETQQPRGKMREEMREKLIGTQLTALVRRATSRSGTSFFRCSWQKPAVGKALKEATRGA